MPNQCLWQIQGWFPTKFAGILDVLFAIQAKCVVNFYRLRRSKNANEFLEAIKISCQLLYDTLANNFL